MAKEVAFLLSPSGEIGTKKPGTQKAFIDTWQQTLKTRLEKLGFSPVIKGFHSRLLLRGPEEMEKALISHLGTGKVFRFYQIKAGFDFKALLPARPFTYEIYVKAKEPAWREKALSLKKNLLKMLAEEAQKRHSLWDNYPPEHLYWLIEGRKDRLFLLANPRKGPGGLPVGTGEKVLVLFSGGPDSLLAAYLLLRRGQKVSLLFFDDEENERYEKVTQAARALAYFLPDLSLDFYTLKYRPFLEELAEKAPKRKICLFCKSLMLILAQKIAEKKGFLALSTGDILGEQASQTLPALSFISHFPRVPVLRPVIALTKEEVYEKLSLIGLKEVAQKALPPCPFAPRHPRTALPKPSQKEEKFLHLLVQKSVILKKEKIFWESPYENRSSPKTC
ncbi:tRNA sulfurtransferase [Thermodesulfatator autotrophicus]|uniref:Thil AANH domain-containing protein n=1 Tax=Thermodesulfatator autotrophicus TaxID=1795632 RepID=A0A177E654_9BACT|nr:hypothetical protein [Thermodesulfatator autotrophicus]OAG26971.1 hypothetical protein TH606_09300 [Thermodesulfatator autotrophicus]